MTQSEKDARFGPDHRHVRRVEDLPEKIIEQIAITEMDPRHNHLNHLLKDAAKGLAAIDQRPPSMEGCR